MSDPWVDIPEVTTLDSGIKATINSMWNNIKTYVSGNGDSAPSNTLQEINDIQVPIGTKLDWHKNSTGAETLSEYFVECSGQMIDDPESAYDGERAPNDNGANVVLTLTWTADGGGAYASVDSADLPALMKGDSVSGSGIDAGTTISDITAGVVTISDTDADGEIESTFANPGRFSRGGTTSGDGDIDMSQRIKGEFNNWRVSGSTAYGLLHPDGQDISGVFSAGSTSYNSVPAAASANGLGLLFDSADSTSPNPAKTSDTETAPIHTTEVRIMRHK